MQPLALPSARTAARPNPGTHRTSIISLKDGLQILSPRQTGRSDSSVVAAAAADSTHKKARLGQYWSPGSCDLFVDGEEHKVAGRMHMHTTKRTERAKASTERSPARPSHPGQRRRVNAKVKQPGVRAWGARDV